MTAQQLAFYNSGPALVAYLGQPDASPAVCDPRSQGPHLGSCTDKVSRALVDGLVGGKIEPGLWRRCVDVLVGTASTDAAGAFIDAIGAAYVKLLLDDLFEGSTPLQSRLSAMQELYLAHTQNQALHLVVEAGMAQELRHGIDKGRFGPTGRRMAAALLEVDDLEHGRWAGHTVDVPRINELATAGDEKTLRLLIAHLPRPDLRDEARRRVIRMHVAASPFSEVREHAIAIEAALMQHGNNPISLAEHPPQSGRLNPANIPLRGVLVRQHVFQQTATLLGYKDQPGLSVLPELSLRGALEVQAQGLSREITLCAPAEELDPSPCVAVETVSLDNPVTYLDKDGAFHFVDNLPMQQAVNLAQLRDRFLLPVSVGGKRLLSFAWHLYYERPEDVVLTGPTPGSSGPNLNVYADHRDPNRFIFTVAGPSGSMLAVVENPEAAAFHVVSAGARGFTGQAGYAGQNGSPGTGGMSASCPGMSGGNGTPGGPGGNGGPGGPGGPGGDGGDIRVELACARGQCRDAVALLQLTVSSVAGPGGYPGPGGPGGAGGQGGAGGSGTSCTNSDGTSTYLSGGSAGYSGPSGVSGPDGPPGLPGRPGRVSVGVAHPGPRS
jgi:hypothetical protein